MKRAVLLAVAWILASLPLYPVSYYVLELRGGSRIYATDAPLKKGRLTLFHRHPDGVLMSVSSTEVLRIETAQEPPRQAEKLAPGQTLYIGGNLEGPAHPGPQTAAQPPEGGYADSGYGGYVDPGYGYGYGWGGYVPPPRPAPAPPRSNIGPNGFPIIAPPGSPGSVTPPIGPNGFPILSPQPPVASPRQPTN